MNRVNEKLLKKYSSTGPRYTSYPPATFFDTKFTNEQYQEKLIESNKESPENISVYIHIPFCPQICHFCGCTTETGFTKPFLERYIDALIKEFRRTCLNDSLRTEGILEGISDPKFVPEVKK